MHCRARVNILVLATHPGIIPSLSVFRYFTIASSGFHEKFVITLLRAGKLGRRN
jgi:hypothetical protein